MLTNRNTRIIMAAALLIVALGGLLLVRYAARRISPEKIRERLVATIQSEARESFLVTGSLQITATTTIENTKSFLPGILDFSLGTSRATVQVPGTAYYGFDVRKIDAKSIRISGDTIDMAVPVPELKSVDANLSEMQVQTEKGWLRSPASVDAVERTAVRRIQNALGRQAADYIANNTQPHVNTAHALEKMLRPVLIAAGIKHPVFKFRLGEKLTLE
jgi:hypothetical protein